MGNHTKARARLGTGHHARARASARDIGSRLGARSRCVAWTGDGALCRRLDAVTRAGVGHHIRASASGRRLGDRARCIDWTSAGALCRSSRS
jgi:hypothetical protein